MESEIVKKEYEKHKFDFENWNLNPLSEFLSELEQQTWNVQNNRVTVKSEKTLVDKLGNACSSHTSDSMDFFYKWGMYQQARRVYEDKIGERR